MKAITIRQPWASLIATGAKTIETRPRRTTYRGRIAIHAATTWAPGWRGVWIDPDRDDDKLRRHDLLVEKLGCDPIEDVNGSGYWTTDTRNVPLGMVVASAVLTDCVPIRQRWNRAESWRGPLVAVDGDGLLIVRPDRTPVWEDVSGQLPFGDFSPGRWALLLDDIRPTTERCPWCWAESTANESCPVCDGAYICDSVPARGQQAVPWEWTAQPEAAS